MNLKIFNLKANSRDHCQLCPTSQALGLQEAERGVKVLVDVQPDDFTAVELHLTSDKGAGENNNKN